MKQILINLKKHSFLFEELVKRDFNSKYKGTSLGVVWSLLSPLLSLLVMRLVFTQFFGRNTAHYTIYICLRETLCTLTSRIPPQTV